MSDMTTRIETMHKRDVQVAWAFVTALWVSIIFVGLATWSLAPSSGARAVLLIGGAIILILNTAAIIAMLKHYREDRDFMYGLDIKFLDAATASTNSINTFIRSGLKSKVNPAVSNNCGKVLVPPNANALQ